MNSTNSKMWIYNRRIFQNEPRCSSRRLFKCYPVYLAKALRTHVHTYTKPDYLQIPEPSILHEHKYYIPKDIVHQKMKNCLTIGTEYADDIGKVIVSENRNCGKEIAGCYKTRHTSQIKQKNSQSRSLDMVMQHGKQENI